MKNLLIILTALLTFNAQADTKTCDIIEDFARTVQQVNQDGDTSLKTAIGFIAQKGYSEALQDVLKEVVLDAYAIQRMNSKSYQNIAVNKFADSAYLTCLRILR